MPQVYAKTNSRGRKPAVARANECPSSARATAGSRPRLLKCSALRASDRGRFFQAAGVVVDRDLVLQDLLDHDLQVGHVPAALDKRARTVHQLDHPLLDGARPLVERSGNMT